MPKKDVQELPLPRDATHPPPELASPSFSRAGHLSDRHLSTPTHHLSKSKAMLAIISADIRYEPHLQNLHCCLEKDVLTPAACRGTSITYTHSMLYRELLPFCFYNALNLAVPPQLFSLTLLQEA